MTKEERVKVFDETSAKLKSEGYTETIHTISVKNANILALVIGIPLFFIMLLVFKTLYPNTNSLDTIELLIFSIALFISIIVHELIHGLAWGIFCKDKFKSISFGMEWAYLTPYCCCSKPLSFHKYMFGAYMPLVILGIIPYIISLYIGNMLLASFAMVSAIGALGDVSLMFILRKEKDSIILDHPTLPGSVSYKKIG